MHSPEWMHRQVENNLRNALSEHSELVRKLAANKARIEQLQKAVNCSHPPESMKRIVNGLQVNIDECGLCGEHFAY